MWVLEEEKKLRAREKERSLRLEPRLLPISFQKPHTRNVFTGSIWFHKEMGPLPRGEITGSLNLAVRTSKDVEQRWKGSFENKHKSPYFFPRRSLWRYVYSSIHAASTCGCACVELLGVLEVSQVWGINVALCPALNPHPADSYYLSHSLNLPHSQKYIWNQFLAQKEIKHWRHKLHITWNNKMKQKDKPES